MASAKSETRDRIVMSAFLLFLRNGFRPTGLSEITAAAGVNPGTFYEHFDDKEKLVVAVLEWCIDNLHREVINPVFERVSDPVERVFGILDGYRRMLAMTEFHQGCPIGNLSIEIGESHHEAQRLIAMNFRQWSDAVRECLEEARGRFPEYVDIGELATFVLTTMEGGVMLARAYRSFEPFDASVSRLRDYFDRLLEDGTQWSSPRTVAKPKAAMRTPRLTRRSPRRKA